MDCFALVSVQLMLNQPVIVQALQAMRRPCPLAKLLIDILEEETISVRELMKKTELGVIMRRGKVRQYTQEDAVPKHFKNS